MIDLVGKKYWFLLISAIIIIPGMIIFGIFGLKMGVDFSSGTAITFHFDTNVELAQLRQQLTNQGYPQAVVQPAGSGDFFVRLQELPAEEIAKLTTDLESNLATKVTITNLYSVSPIVAENTVRNTIIAVLVASIGILLYMTFAFRKMPKPFRWGVVAVITLIHDLLVVIAVFALLSLLTGLEVDSLFVTGVLAVVGISVNNVVVVFDRIRENMKRGVSKDFAQVANVGIIESLGRSLNTGLCTLFVIVSLYLLGGVTIQNLVLALLVGIGIGIYSSICIAGQLLVIWDSGELGRKFSRQKPATKPA